MEALYKWRKCCTCVNRHSYYIQLLMKTTFTAIHSNHEKLSTSSSRHFRLTSRIVSINTDTGEGGIYILCSLNYKLNQRQNYNCNISRQKWCMLLHHVILLTICCFIMKEGARTHSGALFFGYTLNVVSDSNYECYDVLCTTAVLISAGSYRAVLCPSPTGATPWTGAVSVKKSTRKRLRTTRYIQGSPDIPGVDFFFFLLK